MTQQQIAYMNAQTAREQLEVSRMQGEAALKQAAVAERHQEAEDSWKYWTNVATGAISTAAGIIAAALI